MGHHADVIYEANWRATRDNVLAMEELIIQKLEVTRIDTVILCILDNNVYYAVAESGDVSPPKRDKNGVYHMEGDLTISSKSAQQVLFTTIRPLLGAVRGRNVIVCAPMPRFLLAGCCEDPSHMPNRKQGGFEANLVRDLKDTAENLRDYLFTSGFKQYKVLDPAVSWRNKEKDDLWGADPVHPNEAAYSLLADGALHICTIRGRGPGPTALRLGYRAPALLSSDSKGAGEPEAGQATARRVAAGAAIRAAPGPTAGGPAEEAATVRVAATSCNKGPLKD
jgi:hypothetical protein